MGRGVKRIQSPGAAHGRSDSQRLAAGASAKIDHHFPALGVEQHDKQLRTFVLHLEGAAGECVELVHGRLAGNAQAPGRVRRRQRLDAGLRQFFLDVGALGVERIHPQVEPGALVQALDQRPESVAGLLLERLHQPVGQIVAMALHQVGHMDLFTLVKPVLFLFAQCAAQKVSRPVEAQNRQPALLGAAARRRAVVKQELLAQHRVDRLGQRRAFARSQAAVVAEEARNDGVGGMIEL